MAKITMQVNELSDAQPTRVSLVKHAANRTPFRIFKEDNEMGIDLGMAFGALRGALSRKSEGVPQVAAICVRQGFDITAIQPKFEALGYTFANKTEKDGLVLFAQNGVTTGERTGVLKFDDDTALLITSLHSVRSNVPVKKEFSSYNADATTFMDALNTDGFYPSICISVDALQSCIFNIMDEADSTDEAATMVDAAIDEFKAWIMGCVRGIPVKAFKAERDYQLIHTANAGTENAANVGPLGADPETSDLAVRQARADDETRLVTETGDATGAVIVVKAEAAIGVQASPEISNVNASQGGARIGGSGGKQPAVVGNAGSAPIGVQTTEEPDPAEAAQAAATPAGHGGKLPEVVGNGGTAPVGVQTQTEPSAVNASQQEGTRPTGHGGDNTASVLKAELAALLAPMTAALTAVQKNVAQLSTRVEKAEQAVGGTVFSESNNDPVERRLINKSDLKNNGIALLDTAFDRSHLRSAS